MSMPSPPDDPEAPKTTEAVTCLGCGCLCDDIAVTVQGAKIVEVRNVCELGQAWFRQERPETPVATIDGVPSRLDDALARAAGLLAASRSPLVWGLNGLTIEAQAVAVSIADRLGATIDVGHARKAAVGLDALQRVGRVSASYGEVKDRADVIVYWHVDPVTTHPRHLERYSADAVGRFQPQGRAGRTVIVVDSRETATSAVADQTYVVREGRELETLSVLRARLRGATLDADRVREATGLTLEQIDSLVQSLKQARYGAVFAPVQSDALTRLVIDLNVDDRRFVSLTLGSNDNAGGAESVLGWQAGAGRAVDFAPGYPAYRPDEASASTRLDRGEADVLLILGEIPVETLDPEAKDTFERLPKVVIGTAVGEGNVTIRTSLPGLESGGTYSRGDGMMLPLRPVLEGDAPPDYAVLRGLLTQLNGVTAFARGPREHGGPSA